MSTDCMECKIRLVSAAEIKAGMCLQCFPLAVQNLLEVKKNYALLLHEKKELDELLACASARSIREEELARAEKDGTEACSRGTSREDNPHPEESDESFFWESGWYDEWFPRELQRIKAVMAWSLEGMAPARELAKGYGHGDLVSQIDQIISKIGPYLEELIDEKK